jgi:hypothetical protein
MEEDPNRLLTHPELPGPGGVMAKEKNTDIFFFQPTPLVILVRAETTFNGESLLIINLDALVKIFLKVG